MAVHNPLINLQKIQQGNSFFTIKKQQIDGAIQRCYVDGDPMAAFTYLTRGDGWQEGMTWLEKLWPFDQLRVTDVLKSIFSHHYPQLDHNDYRNTILDGLGRLHLSSGIMVQPLQSLSKSEKHQVDQLSLFIKDWHTIVWSPFTLPEQWLVDYATDKNRTIISIEKGS